MRRYETIFISDPDLPEEERHQLFEKTKELVARQNGVIGWFDEWGSKRLTYDIKKKNRGYYVRLDYCGSGPLVDELERSFKIDDRVLKFMTIVMNKNMTLEAFNEEIKKEKELKDQKEKAAAQYDTIDRSISDIPDADALNTEKNTEENSEENNDER